MTAEIAILNKNAVALAADSAVTISQPGAPKIYNTANKLFMLSKYRPVGVMIFGNAALMGVPWETIIKDFRRKLSRAAFDSLEEYGADFRKYLRSNNPLFPAELQDEQLSLAISQIIVSLRDQVDRAVDGFLQEHGKIVRKQLRVLLQYVIETQLEKSEALNELPDFKEDRTKLNSTIRTIAKQRVGHIFQKFPITASEVKKISRIAEALMCKESKAPDSSGIVIAGFGEKEYFPRLLHFDCSHVIDNRLRYFGFPQLEIGHDTTAAIAPFAQSEMVHMFLNGIDSGYRSEMLAYLSSVLTSRYPDLLSKELAVKLSAKEIAIFKKALEGIGAELIQKFQSGLEDFQQKRFTDPVVQIVASLPVDELAAMAESLVNLTSFKRRVSAQSETVGGPIDVAVISKGDGFIWIKRKHYFEGNLNHSFFTNYHRKDDLDRDKAEHEN